MEASPLRVCAGPGTGKTFALMRRVARLLEAGVEPSSIFIVTFTRTAARDLLTNLQNLGVPGADQVRSGTLHSFCFQVLSRGSVLEVTGRVPRPLMNFEQRFLEEDLKRPDRSVQQCRRLIKAFEASWARLQHETPGWPQDAEERQFHQELMEWLTEHRCILLGELVTEMRAYLRNNPLCPERRVFDHVLVDEYQDLNRADQEVIDLLAESGTLTVVGDEDQAIYSRLRFAQPESIRDFPEYHPNTHDEPLVFCRRCPDPVVHMANSLIEHNVMRADRHLEPSGTGDRGGVSILQWTSMEEEAQGLADLISEYIEQTKPNLRDVLVLAPRRTMGNQIRDHLIDHGHDAYSYFFEETFESDDAKKRFTLLNLLVNRDDRVSLRCWLGLERSGLAARQYARLRTYCNQHGIKPLEALEQMQAGEIAIPYCGPLVERFAELQVELAALEGLEDEQLVDALFPPKQTSVELVRQLARLTLESAAEALDAKKLLGDLRTRVIYPEPPPAGDYVRIMSPYKSKGLTAKLVVVASCIEGCLPSLYSDLEGEEARRDLEEQRRLFYVAITRPTDRLVLSSFLTMPLAVAHRMRITLQGQHGDRAHVLASRFFRELGPTAPDPQAGRLVSSA